jgi:hypothetical protein
MMGPRVLVSVLASMLVAAPVLAQPKTPQSDQQKQQLAGELVKKAITRSQDGDHIGAIDLYLQAYSLIREHTLLSNIGNEYQQAQKPVEALKYFCMYLDKDPTGTNATYAQTKAKALQMELGNKAVDDRDVCRPAARAPEQPDQPIDSTTPPPPPPPGGSGSPLRWIGLGVGGVGAVAVAAGVFFGVKAQKDSDFISNYRETHPTDSWPDNIHAIEDRGQSYENKQIAFTIAGGVLVAAGVVMFVVGQSSGSKSKSESVTVTPTASRDGAGIALDARF